MFYRTDLDHMFYYDSSRTAWLGLEIIKINAGNNLNGITTAIYMASAPGGGQTTGTRNDPLPWNAMLVAVTTIARGTVTNTNVILRRGGSNIRTINLTSADASDTTGQVHGPFANTDWTAGDLLQVYLDPTPGGDSVNLPRVAAWFRRVAT
jgi:hypothetical protein